MDGKWWGGYYGWRWPHGFHTIIEPCMIAAENAYLLTGDPSYLDLPRSQLDRIASLGKMGNGALLVPYRHRDDGWTGYRPLDPTLPIHLWYMSMDTGDEERLQRVCAGQDWNGVPPHAGKGDGCHAGCWYNFIKGKNPSYPETICQVNYEEICRRMEMIRNDEEDLDKVDVHHWQSKNPVIIEALVHLMLGSPYIIYHGGLLHTRLRYFDGHQQRPGVPEDVAALVSRVDAGGIDVELVNISPHEERQVILQAGNFGEHRFTSASVVNQDSGEVAEPIEVNGRHLTVNLRPGSGVKLILEMERYVNTPTYALPWDR